MGSTIRKKGWKKATDSIVSLSSQSEYPGHCSSGTEGRNERTSAGYWTTEKQLSNISKPYTRCRSFDAVLASGGAPRNQPEFCIPSERSRNKVIRLARVFRQRRREPQVFRATDTKTVRLEILHLVKGLQLCFSCSWREHRLIAVRKRGLGVMAIADIIIATYWRIKFKSTAGHSLESNRLELQRWGVYHRIFF